MAAGVAALRPSGCGWTRWTGLKHAARVASSVVGSSALLDESKSTKRHAIRLIVFVQPL